MNGPTPLRNAAALLLCLSAHSAFAQTEDPMTGAEFDAYSRGKILTYADEGYIYGTEEYLSDRRVRWAFTQEECQIGHWYETNDRQICFVYDQEPNAQCWKFFLGPNGMTAQSMNEGSDQRLDEVQQTNEPLACAGPDVGV